MTEGADPTVIAAFAVGFVSFISPCVLPLVPGYLSAVSGVSLADSRETLDKIAGAIIIALGVFFLATPFVPRLNRDWRPDALISRAGSGGPIVAGAAFAIAWTPCIGPTLGTILNVAATQDTVGKGGVLLAFYSAGLAVPFLLTAVAFTRMTSAFAFLRDHYLVITALSGVILITMGVLLFTGELKQINIKAQETLDGLGLNVFKSL